MGHRLEPLRVRVHNTTFRAPGAGRAEYCTDSVHNPSRSLERSCRDDSCTPPGCKSPWLISEADNASRLSVYRVRDGLAALQPHNASRFVGGRWRDGLNGSSKGPDGATVRRSMPDAGPTPPTPTTEALGSIRCSFCGKRGTEVERIVAGSKPGVAICNECIVLCAQIVAEERGMDGPPDTAA